MLRHRPVIHLALVSLLALACSPAQPAPSAQPPKPPAGAAAPAPQATQPPKPAVQATSQAPATPEQRPTTAPSPTTGAASKAPAPDARRLFWGGGPAVSPYYAYAIAAARVINEQVPQTQVTVSEMTGAVAGLKRLQAGEFGMLSTQLGLVYEAYKGLEQFKDSPISDLRVLWTVNTTANAYVVRQDSGITNITDLKGREFAGGTGTYTEVLAKQGLAAIEAEPRWYRGGLEDALVATKDRRIVGFVKSVGSTSPDAGVLEVQTTTPVRVLNWPEELIAKVKQKYEYHVDGTIAPGVYKNAGNDGPIRTWVAPVIVVAKKDLDPEIAYQIVKAVEREREPQTAAFKPSGESDFIKLTAELSPLPVHAGVLRYIKERGLPVRPAIVPPEAQ
ncbi:MAG: TAXI family TRAP transporter solute-binding subunit [Chloroflexi bacterium]|nr:TAXI family TRAP transporter solute-binding subunit [Chloroflexota bacterium]